MFLPLQFNKALDWFYCQQDYQFMLFFISSGKYNEAIADRIIDNTERILEITGDKICFSYFIENQERIGPESSKIYDVLSSCTEYGFVYVTKDVIDDICKCCKIEESDLPAFILIDRSQPQYFELMRVHSHRELELFLTPINIIHWYKEQKNLIKSRREKAYKQFNYKIKEDETDKREKHLLSWKEQIDELKRRGMILLQHDELQIEHDVSLSCLYLQDYPEEYVDTHDLDDYFTTQTLLAECGNRLNIILNCGRGTELVYDLEKDGNYSKVVLEIWKNVHTRSVSVEQMVDNIHIELSVLGNLEILIVCSDKDYEKAHGVFDYLIAKGYRPFLPDLSNKDIETYEYQRIVTNIRKKCKFTLLFHIDYTNFIKPNKFFEPETLYYSREKSKVICITSKYTNYDSMPYWMWNEQCFTTGNYRDNILYYLREVKNEYEFQYRVNNEFEMYLDYLYDNLVDLERRVNIMAHSRNLSLNRQELDELSMAKEFIQCFSRKIDEVREIRETNERRKLYVGQILAFERIKGKCINRIEHSFYERKQLLEQKNEVKLESQCDKIDFGTSATDSIFQRGKKKLARDRNENYQQIECCGSASEEFLKLLFQDDDCSQSSRGNVDYESQYQTTQEKLSVFSRIFGINRKKEVFSSVFAPAEVKPKSPMLIQVYLHLFEDAERVKALAKESHNEAERRDYVPLQCKLRKGDKVDVMLNIAGEKSLLRDRKSIVWNGELTKCSFDYFVGSDLDVDKLCCVIMLSVNGIPVGEMRFITSIVDSPRNLHPEIFSHIFKKIFISYAHQDIDRVKFIAKAYKAQGVNYFFDRDNLKGGDIYEKKILDFIDSSDLFILCWSTNSEVSEYVAKEKAHALSLAYPQKEISEATLTIYPISIEPRASLPKDMVEIYNFEEV